jgi:DNA-binding NtrC family response regulator
MVAPIGKSRVMQELREQVQRVAAHDTPVLLVGEAGTGREAFARYLHSLSSRSQAPFVALVASAINDGNADRQLLGAEAGGNVEPGLLERSRGGILFINELEDLCPRAQTVLLGALERQSFIREGGTASQRLDVRMVSSARPGVEHATARGRLRQDLLSQLNVLTLRVPPLREYAEDVPELLRYYVDKLVDEEDLPYRRFSVAAQNRLRNYPWPGNVRDLKNLVHRLLVLEGNEEIGLKELETQLAAAPSADEPLVKQDLLALPLREAREQFERAYLQQQLILCGGKVGQLAKRVGMERTHLYRKLRSLGVDFRQAGGED